MSVHTAAATPPGMSALMLLREDVAGVAILTLNQPRSRNTLSEAMLETLGDAFTAIVREYYKLKDSALKAAFNKIEAQSD